MRGIKPDFDYDERTLRKFAAGDFFERMIGYVLITSGLLKHDNKWYNLPPDETHLEVSVKPDFIAGGKPDWEKIKAEIEVNSLFSVLPVFERIVKALVGYLSEKYPEGLGDLLYEIKSVNSQVFWAKKDYLREAYPHHQFQCLTGMKATNLPEGRILYISKDDLTVAEFPVFLDDKELNEKWEEDVVLMTKYIKEGVEPPKPESVVFDPRKKLYFQYNKEKQVIEGCWTPNWEVEWSNYLPTITGFKSVEKWKASSKEEARIKNKELKDEYKND